MKDPSKGGRRSVDLGRLQLLKSVPMLSRLAPDQMTKLLERAEVAEYHQGEYIVQQGEVGDAMYIIEEGGGQVRIDNIGDVDKRYSPGEVFGELSLLTHQPRGASVVASCEPTRCLRVLSQHVANGIRVFMVFDGRRLPGKNGTDAARLKKRCAAQAQVDAAVERAEAKANARRSSSKAGKALRKTASDMAEDLDAGTFEIEIEEKTLRAAAAVTDILMLLLALVSLLDRYPVFVRKCFRDGGVGCWPLNLYGAHWCGLVVDGRRRRFEPQASAVGDTCQTIDGRRLRSGEQYMFVGYFDSMGGPCPPTLLSAVRRAIRRTRHEQGDSACTWAWAADLGVMANMQALQNADTYQCGVWTLLFESFVLRFVSTKAPGSLRSWLRACAGIPLDAHTRSVWMPNYAAESQSPKTCHYADKLC